MEFALESATDVVEEVVELIQGHHNETGTLDDGEFAPDIARYLEMDRAGFMRVFTARSGGKLVGYCILYVMPHLHYRHTLWAHQDSWFLCRNYRGRGSLLFLKFMDQKLAEEEVSVVLRGCHVRNDYSRLLKHIGYEKNSVVYLRRV